MSKKIALIVVDVQNDFCPGGSLPVKDGNLIVPVINRIVNDFQIVVFTKDWHPKNHGSFASNHGAQPYTLGELKGLPQVLWPDHCVQDTKGAELHKELLVTPSDFIITKGKDPTVDSYSGFFDNNKENPTGLEKLLRDNDVYHVFICGLATDYCVKFTAIDAASLGFHTTVIVDACRGVFMNPADEGETYKQLIQNKVDLIRS